MPKLSRFLKIERARPDGDGAKPATTGRFNAIEERHGEPSRAPAPDASGRFKAAPKPEVMLEVEDDYSREVARTKHDRAEHALADVIERRKHAEELQARPRDESAVLAWAARTIAVGPLARLGDEPRTWIVLGAAIVVWMVIGAELGFFAAIVALGVAIGITRIRAR